MTVQKAITPQELLSKTITSNELEHNKQKQLTQWTQRSKIACPLEYKRVGGNQKRTAFMQTFAGALFNSIGWKTRAGERAHKT
eukprot:3413203-Amphidinium_carterae.1